MAKTNADADDEIPLEEEELLEYMDRKLDEHIHKKLDELEKKGLAKQVVAILEAKLEEKNRLMAEQVARLQKTMGELLLRLPDEPKSPEPEPVPQPVDGVDEKKMSSVKKSNIRHQLKKSLREGKLTEKMYEELKVACDTKITQSNMVEAYKAYCEFHELDVSEDVTFEGAMEHMKAILKL